MRELLDKSLDYLLPIVFWGVAIFVAVGVIYRPFQIKEAHEKKLRMIEQCKDDPSKFECQLYLAELKK